MIIRECGDGVLVHAPAKLNLFLDVGNRRADGFHDLETVIMGVALYDSLRFELAPAGEFALQSELHQSLARDRRNDLPPPKENAVVRALQALAEAAGVERGMRVQLTKRIPSQSGLGGASSDAAAALLAANQLWQLDWTDDQLAEVGAGVGSDVPFFFYGPCARCTGRGEIVEPLRSPRPLYFVLVHPPEGLSTADVFAQCRPGRQAESDRLLDAIERGDQADLVQSLHNSLETAAEELQPWVGRLRHAFARAGCRAFQMSGSGTSFFGLCHHPLHAQRVAGRLRSRQVGQVHCVKSTRHWSRARPSLN